MILFGGVADGDLRFCNAACQEKGHLARVAKRIPHRDVQVVLEKVHQGRCPQCNAKGPIDVHVKHTVWSAVYLTSWNSTPTVCCRSCGRKAQLGGLAFSALLGWWGFPWGLIMTPIQICRNMGGICGGPNPDEPSAELENIVRLGMAAGDFGSVRGTSRRGQLSEDDDDFIEDAFETDDDDDGYDDVEVVTKSNPKQRTPANRSLAADDHQQRATHSSAKRSSSAASSSDRVTCPNCDASFKASAAVRGKRVKCPKCSGVINVPE